MLLICFSILVCVVIFLTCLILFLVYTIVILRKRIGERDKLILAKNKIINYLEEEHGKAYDELLRLKANLK